MSDDEIFKAIDEIQRPQIVVDMIEGGQEGYAHELDEIEQMISDFLQQTPKELDIINSILENICQAINTIPPAKLQNIQNIEQFFQQLFLIIIFCTREKNYHMVCECLNTLQIFISKNPQLSLYFDPPEEKEKKEKKEFFISDEEQPRFVKEDEESGIFALKCVLNDTDDDESIPYLTRFELAALVISNCCRFKPFAVSYAKFFFESLNNVIFAEATEENFENLYIYHNVLFFFNETLIDTTFMSMSEIESCLETLNLLLQKTAEENILKLLFTYLVSLLQDPKMIFAVYSHNIFETVFHIDLFSSTQSAEVLNLYVDFLNTSMSIDDAGCKKLHNIISDVISPNIDVEKLINFAQSNIGDEELFDNAISLIFNKIVTDDSVENLPLEQLKDFCTSLIQESPLLVKIPAVELYIEILKNLSGDDFWNFFNSDVFVAIMEEVGESSEEIGKLIFNFLPYFHEELIKNSTGEILLENEINTFLDEIDSLEWNNEEEINQMRVFFQPKTE